MQGWRNVAYIASRKGLDGKLLLRHSEAVCGFIKPDMEFALVPPKLDIPRNVTVESVSQVSETDSTVIFYEISDIDTAEAVVGMSCLVDSNKYDVPNISQDNLYLDIDGFAVNDVNLGHIGHVIEVEDRLMQPLLHVCLQGSEKEALIPLADEILINVDIDAQEILLECPNGLLEMQGFIHED